MIAASLAGADRLVARFAAMPSAVTARVAQTVARLSGELQDRVQNDKLGGAVLRRRSGRLADSVRVSLVQSGAAVVATLGSDVPYAAIHEFGGTIPPHTIVPTSARVLAFPWKGQLRFFRRVAIPAVQMPRRSFLRSALDDMTPEIGADIAAAVREGVHE